MQYHLHNLDNNTIVELISDKIEILNVTDVLDIIGNAESIRSRKIIIRQEHMSPEFFELETGIAGEILQKFANYDIRLAIIGDFTTYNSKNLKDFIYESNKAGQFIFVSTLEEAIQRLSL
jgi:hypothetical protein